jgi:hypothetical protein
MVNSYDSGGHAESSCKCSRGIKATTLREARRYFFNWGGMGVYTLKLSPSEVTLPEKRLM